MRGRVEGLGSRVGGMILCAVLGVSAPLGAQSPTPDPRPQTRLLDSFDALDGWSAHPSDGVTLDISSDPAGAHGRAMRLDFDFHGGGGYAIARKKFDVPLPANYAFTFRVRGAARPQNLEFKLIDSTGENVWWSNQRDFSFPRDWTTVTRKRRHISFAWGPIGGGELHRVATVEFVITAGQGGKGTVWLDDFALTPLEPVAPGPMPRPTITASSSSAGHAARLAADGDRATYWHSADTAPATLTLDLGAARELGGLVIDWGFGEGAADYAIDASPDGAHWEELRRVTGSDGGRDLVDVPEAEGRRIRIRMLRPAGPRGYAIDEVAVQPLAWSATPDDFARAVARAAPRGTYPRYLTDSVQAYWTLVGTSGDRHEGLLGDDGALESGRGGYSVEPFLRAGDSLITWASVERTASLEEGALPIPSVTWTPRDSATVPLTLTVTAFASGTADASTLHARYRVANRGGEPRSATLYLAIRPFQVNPPWQFLNAPGGVALVRSIRREGDALVADSARPLVPLTHPTAVGASSLDRGEIVESLRRGVLPSRTRVVDDQGRASAALGWELTLAPGETRDVWIALPPPTSHLRPPTSGASALTAAIRSWREQLGRVTVELPDAGSPRGTDVAATLRSTLAYILINRNGPAIQPGSRSYSRSWIRDGALTSAALLRLGHPEEVKQFIEWFAPYQYPNGKIPCCVDARGADPVPENDSHGEFIYLVAEYYRYTGDRALLERMWPHVSAAAAYIDSLRHQRMTPEYQTPEKRAFYGLLPESISHEGYSAKPMHSYWDDFFALKGLKDATDLAAALGRESDRARLAAIRDEFRRDLYASLNAVISTRSIAYVPGSVELADFDATSTTTAIEPGGELANLPQPALRQGFDRYFRGVMARRDSVWEGYTPYELRTVGSFVRMGQRTRAHAVLADLMEDRRPAAWNQWAEVVFRDPATPRFIGDMPHTWVGSDFIRSTLDMFAYDREADSALVVGAGVQEAWASTAPGVVVRGLRTAFGPLDLTVRTEGSVSRLELRGAARVPRGGFVVRSPRAGLPRSITVNGARVTGQPGGETYEVVVRKLPAVVEFGY